MKKEPSILQTLWISIKFDAIWLSTIAGSFSLFLDTHDAES